MTWETVQAFLSIVGGITGPWTLFRSYWATRSKVMISQKADPGYSFVEWLGDHEALIVTLLISNKSSLANSVLQYEAAAALSNGEKRTLTVEQGTITIRRKERILAERHVCVTPLNLPPHTTTEAHLRFDIEAKNFADPLIANIIAVDMHGKRFSATCSVPNARPAHA